MSTMRKMLFVLSAIPFLAFFFLWGMSLYDHSLRDPAGIETYAQWEAKFGKPEGTVLRFKKGDRTFYQVSGKIPTAWGADGHPGYVFDAEGRLCDWTPDLNEGSDYYMRWPVMRLEARQLPYRAFIRLLPAGDL